MNSEQGKPKVFIGSSVEKLHLAHVIQTALQYDTQPTAWDQGVFNLSSNTLDSLIKELNKSDFGVFIFSPEDILQIRDQQYLSVRDNVIFELGLFIGRLGKEKTYFVVPSGQQNLRLPTDLLGITPATFDANRDDGNFYAALGPASDQIRQHIKQLWLSRRPEIKLLQLLPRQFIETIRPLLRRPELQCTYTVLQGSNQSEPKKTNIIPIKGGLYINIMGVSPQELIQINVCVEGQSWTSDYEAIDSPSVNLKQD